MPLLRIYWYDGTNGRPSLQQAEIGGSDDAKLRLGFVNELGQQKGVDSLMTTDMIDLARNRTMADALLVTGDGDLRVGMDQAQGLGVRVHLLRIEQARSNQPRQLRQEADTTHCWHRDIVESFLRYVDADAWQGSATVATPAPLAEPVAAGTDLSLGAPANETGATPHPPKADQQLTPAERESIAERLGAWANGGGRSLRGAVPPARVTGNGASRPISGDTAAWSALDDDVLLIAARVGASVAAMIPDEEMPALLAVLSPRSVPSDWDRHLLAQGSRMFEVYALSPAERREIRRAFYAACHARAAGKQVGEAKAPAPVEESDPVEP